MADKYAYLFKNPDAYATCLIQVLADMYGTAPVTAAVRPEDQEFDWGFLSWDPATMEAELSRDLGFRPPDEVLTKIQAASGLLLNDLFHFDLNVFVSVCQSLSRGLPMTGEFIPAGLRDMAWGVMEANLLEGPDFWSAGFSRDIGAYAGLILDNHGIYDPPEILKFATGRDEMQTRMLENLEGDPELYNAALQRQEDEKRELQAYLNGRTAGLVRQWMDLPIPYLDREGDAARLLKVVS